MTGYTKDENSLATGIPDRNIGPETGSFGNATKTNSGDTSEGTNQDHEARPPGLEDAKIDTDDLGENRSFASGGAGSARPDIAPGDVELAAQQIADGGDRFDSDKRLGEDDDRERKIERRDSLDHTR